MVLKNFWDNFTDRFSLTIIHPQIFYRKYCYTAINLAKKHARGVLVDVGCGRMPYKRGLSPYVDRYIGVDNLKTPFLRADNRPDILADAKKLPLPNSFADTVLLLMVLEHLQSPSQVLSEINRVLKKNGVLILSTLQSYPVHDHPHDFFRFTKFGIFALLENNGFQTVVHKPEGNVFIQIFQEINLFLMMEIKRISSRRFGLLPAILLLSFVFPLAIISNLLAFPFLFAGNDSRFAVIHTVVAKKMERKAPKSPLP